MVVALMELTRRFIFRGNAAAIGGRLVRPADVVVEASGSALPVTGGRSVSRLPGRAFTDELRFGSATTFAEGVFDNPPPAATVSWGSVREDTLTSSTRVSAEIADVVVGAKPRLTVKRLRAELSGRSPVGGGEPPIRIEGDKQTLVEGVSIDGHSLLVVIDVTGFQRCDTRAKLVVAADDAAFVAEYGDLLFMKSGVDGRPVPPAGRLLEYRGTIYATIVRKLQWDGAPFPGAEIDHHTVFIPDFGRIFFGELLISAAERRLTMMRLKLGSPVAGDVAMADVDTNGSWSS
jgi:hypothetical protein